MGGAGIIMSGTLMRDLKPYLPICSHSFTGIMFASDMRLSLCAERFLGVTANSYINNELQHGNGPKITQTKPKYNSAPISYHNIVSPLTIHLWQSHVTTWDDKYIDWSNISMSEITFEYGIEHVMVEMQWGYAMYINGRSKKEDMCITQFEPIFSANDTERLNPREFVQKYQNGFTIRTVCDDDLEEHEIVFDSFLFDEYGCKFRVKCPMVRKFLSNFPGGSSPAKIIYEPTEEV
ncbi:hypothetical protein GPJ56_009073 [Histomonas meleagridis]|uniref:uncharacterized protein n=1 Tax=Histomonas meleagridis TaxID=135588 RepID=UPI00355A6329|nr:hypothetical protein GPJ56_009073 [Histomonas meleagridis]KAH0799270.1 hypothetical protein GO595_008067 [Histomonas meleagridis]